MIDDRFPQDEDTLVEVRAPVPEEPAFSTKPTRRWRRPTQPYPIPTSRVILDLP